MISHEKSAKIKNRRSSRHVLLKSTWRDDRRFASWRIIITDIQSGNIGGLAGRNQSLPKFAIFALDSSHFSLPTFEVCSRSIPKILGGSFGEHPLFDEYADRGWEGGCTVVHGFCIWSIGLELFTCRCSGWRFTVEVLTGHGTESTVCINGYWCENHLIVEKITDDIIA